MEKKKRKRRRAEGRDLVYVIWTTQRGQENTTQKRKLSKTFEGNSLVVQWLGLWFNPWLGNQDLTNLWHLAKGKKKYFRGIKEVFCYEHQSKTTFQEGGYLGIPWRFSCQDSLLTLSWAHVRSLARKLRSHMVQPKKGVIEDITKWCRKVKVKTNKKTLLDVSRFIISVMFYCFRGQF